MTKKARDPTIKTRLDVSVGGVAVKVALDEDGRPLYANAGGWGDDGERLATLAAHRVFDAAEDAVTRTRLADAKTKLEDADQEKAKEAEKRMLASAKGVANSAEKRIEASRKHPANQWLALAHAKDPSCGRAKLMRTARQLAAAAGIDSTERNKITDDRARRFLDRQRKT